MFMPYFSLQINVLELKFKMQPDLELSVFMSCQVAFNTKPYRVYDNAV